MERITLIEGRRIVLGVTGSIAAFKAADLASKLTQMGALVDVIMTEAAQRFVTPLTFRALTGRPVYTDMWATDNSGGLPTHIAHVGLGEGADLLAIVPATANHIARLTYGLADDLLTLTALNVRCPVLLAPAMDGDMYVHPATTENIRRLQERGIIVVPPESGRMASGLEGRGRLPEVPTLVGLIRHQLGREVGQLRGRSIVVTAGGTREAIDPVRYVSNRSSGKQGYAVAQAALDAGAQVTLITAPTVLEAPVGATVIDVESAQDMYEAVMNATEASDALVMAAAVADYRPRTVAEQKIKKSSSTLSLSLTRTQDILQAVGERRAETGFPHVLIGFAAETHDLMTNAESKLKRKNADYIIANDVTAEGAGFQYDTNVVTILGADGSVVSLPQQTKAAVAEAIIQRIATRLQTVPRR
ncbi:MAG TPA: bifunctional phosphopantothenoylcysteine decarboxylase/phosphopantothenate--cysteine ligase CoaBC [Aggregatilineales bacterium]|nr:bifunctional phosphopantothenoylcysteine decarboxylase/phosphopantothenate--cysteine ligase CoaBC [Aggregatilineales bacterium]